MGFFDKLDDITGSIKDAAGDVVEFIDDKVDLPVIIDVKGIKAAGGAVYVASRETSDLCHDTIDKASEVVAFGLELKDTLDGLSADGTLDASKFEVIKDLVDGDRIRAATALAGELGGLALRCVDKSQDMMDAIEQGIDSLPDIIEDRIDDKLASAAAKGGKESDPDLPDVEQHSRELQTLISDVEGVSLFTVMSAGKQAFDGLRSKGEVCQDMFATVRSFAEDVSSVSDAIQNFTLDIKAFKTVKDLMANAWRCLRLSSLIKAFSEGVEGIIQWIVSLFRKASEKLGSIWGALARAKDVLADCVVYVHECVQNCNDAKGRSTELCDLSAEITDLLRGAIPGGRKGSQSAIASIKDLCDGDEIRRALALATTMDDIVKECVAHILDTIKKVCGAIKSMPAVLTEGLAEATGGGDGDAGEEGGGGAPTIRGQSSRALSFGVDEDDETPPADGVDVTGDVAELDGMRGAVEEANIFEAVGKSADGFDGIGAKVALCGDMIVESRGFADTCRTAIASFGGAWDLESAQGHIVELFEIVSLGKLIQHFAQEIARLLRANIALMEAVRNKFKDIDFVPDQIEDLIEDVGDSLKDLGKKMKFWD